MDLFDITVNGGQRDFWLACLGVEMLSLLKSKGENGEDRPESIEHYVKIGLLNLKLGMCQEALEYLSKAHKLQEEWACMDSYELADLYVYIGSSFFEMGNYPQAMKYCTKAKGIYAGTNDNESQRKLSRCCNTIKKCQNKLADQK